MSEDEVEEQPALLPDLARAAVRRTKAAAATSPRPAPTVAAVDPVAQVLVDVPLAHLDRPFDYAVPEAMAETAVPGARVKVRFAGQDVDGFVVARCATSDHTGRLAPLRRVVSAEPVLTRAVADLAGAVAARYAGTTSDVLRLAVPPRHAATEKRPGTDASPPPTAPQDPDGWTAYDGGAAWIDALGSGTPARAVWTAAPAEDWPHLLAVATRAVAATGRGALLCVPDKRDVDRLDAALTAELGPGRHVVLTADAGPARRYAAFLAVLRGQVQVVVGTRAAAFAPVRDLGLVVVWDDGDDLHAEPRAPYPHAREVLLERARREDCAALVGGFACTVEATYLLRTGWARSLAPPRALVRERVRVQVPGAADRDVERDPFARSSRLPRIASDTVRSALAEGPVLVQTPRQGYAASLACDRCATPARCTACSGPLRQQSRTAPLACRWCAREEAAWTCPTCSGHGLRAPVVGERRTAEELGRAFPGVPVRTSAGDHVLAAVGPEPALVVATPGAEPVAEGGYPAVLLLDSWLMLARPDLRTEEESLRRWLNAGALVRPGGRVVVVGDSAHPAVQALVRWDPLGAAERELQTRQETHLPPASRLATVVGEPDAVAGLVDLVHLPDGTEVLGPVPVPPGGGPASGAEEEVRTVLRVPRRQGAALSAALREAQSVRAARKLPAVRVQVDPAALG
ncbi:MAG: primosomal protein N' [Nocardioides sp.]|nr:primosomal protein N' [Nocardioides sp.]